MTSEGENRRPYDPEIAQLCERYPELESCVPSLRRAAESLVRCFSAGGKLLICGNGGSAADAEHIAGELMKGFMKKRPLPQELRNALIAAAGHGGEAAKGKLLGERLQVPLPALALTGQVSLSTAFANDVAPDMVFAQQVLGYGARGDLLLGISTSGNAANVLYALITAKARGMGTIGLTGASGGAMAAYCDVLLAVPRGETPLIQELHLPLYHALCRMTEQHFFAE